MTFGIFKRQQQADQFDKRINKIYTDLDIQMNNRKKQLDYIIDFFGLKFNNLQIEAQLPKNKLKKTIKKVVKILKKKNSTTHEELQSLVGLFSFAVKIVCLGQAFLQCLYNVLVKGEKYLH